MFFVHCSYQKLIKARSKNNGWLQWVVWYRKRNGTTESCILYPVISCTQFLYSRIEKLGSEFLICAKFIDILYAFKHSNSLLFLLYSWHIYFGPYSYCNKCIYNNSNSKVIVEPLKWTIDKGFLWIRK